MNELSYLMDKALNTIEILQQIKKNNELIIEGKEIIDIQLSMIKILMEKALFANIEDEPKLIKLMSEQIIDSNRFIDSITKKS